MRNEDRHLRERKGKWHYVRRVPASVQDLDGRDRIEITLKTSSLDVARIRRDAMEEADDKLWASLLAGTGEEAARARYEANKRRCLALGFTWRTLDQLEQESPVEEIVERVLALKGKEGRQLIADSDAVLGRGDRPTEKVSEALKIYFREIAPDQLRGKSPRQVQTFKKVKQRAVSNFIKVAGDIPMGDITRENGNAFYAFWRDRVTGKKGAKVSPNSGNRDVGNMRKLYADYFSHIGDEDRQNPFRDLRFRERKSDKKKRPPFATEWIRDRILVPGALDGLNRQAACIVLTMIETGCRPSELCNMPAKHIHLEADVPHIEVEFQEGRELKTESSIRRIPLVGAALAAMELCPEGFPRYHDKEEAFLQTARKHFRRHKLFPSEDHVIYSLRHSFEKRMMEGGLDPDLRRLLFGHAIDREEYGDGGSLVFRRDELLKIVLPFEKALVSKIEADPN
jgi:integrase